MGKTKTKVLGIDAVEKEQKEKAKKRNEQKKAEKAKVEKAEDKRGLERSREIQEVVSETKSDSDTKEKKKKSVEKVRVHGKKYSEFSRLVEKTKSYTSIEAAKLLKKKRIETFNATIELHINVREQGLKGEVALPHGTGKEVKVVIFSPAVEKQLQDNKFDFDILIARPADMKSLVKFAKLLGPKGLMPSPKKGTLVEDVAATQNKFQAGAVNYKTEPKFPIIHQIIGKIDFTEVQIAENIDSFLLVVGSKNIEKAFVKSTMSPTMQLVIQTE